MDDSGMFVRPLMSSENPFVVGEVRNEAQFLHRELFHRTERELTSGLTSLFIITGNRGTGKTSLMLHLLRLSEADHVRNFTAYVDAHLFTQGNAGIECLRGILQRLLSQYDTAGEITSRFERLADGRPDDLHQSAAPAHAHPAVGGRTYAFYLDVDDLMRRHPNVPSCVIAVDNMDMLSPDDRQNILNRMLAIRGWSDGKISIILVGGTALNDEAKRRDERMLPVQLTPWTLSEAAAYVRRRELYERKMLVSDEQIDHLWEASEGSPRVLAYLCFELFEQKKREPRPRFELNTEVIESVAEALTRKAEIEPLIGQNLIRHDLTILRAIVPFHGWSSEELAHYQLYQRFLRQSTGQALPEDANEEIWRLSEVKSRFEANMEIYRQRGQSEQHEQHEQRGILLPAGEGADQSPARSLTTGLQRAYLRIRAAELLVRDWPDLVIEFQGHTPTYEQWVERELQRRITRQFEAQGLQPWARLRIPAPSPPVTLREWIEQWEADLRDGLYDPQLDPRQVRLFEEPTGHYTHKQAAGGEHLFSNLAERRGAAHAVVLGVQCQVEHLERPLVLLFGKANEARQEMGVMRDEIDREMRSLGKILGLSQIDVDSKRVSIPPLEEIMRAAKDLPKPNRELLLSCFYAFISLGRRDLDRAEIERAEQWFTHAIEIEGLSAPFRAIAYQHLGMVFLARAQMEMERGRRSQHLTTANEYIAKARAAQDEAIPPGGGQGSAFDTVLMSKAMIDSDLAYARILGGATDEAIKLCQHLSLEPSTESIIGTMAFVKLCDVEGLSADVCASFDNEFARWMLLAASIYCTLAAGHAQHGAGGRAAAEAALKRAEELQPDHYMVKRARGRFYLRYGQPEQAIEYFRAAQTALGTLHDQRAEDAPGGKATAYSNVIRGETDFAEAAAKKRPSK